MDSSADFGNRVDLAEGSGPLFAERTTRVETGPARRRDRGPAGRGDAATVAESSVDGELLLSLRLTDPEVVAELGRRPAGPERERFALAALRVGVLALRSAGGTQGADQVREAGHKLLADLRETLATRATELTSEMARSLTSYFDPQSGLVSQKIDRLVADGGELERLMRAQVGDESLLARTLAAHLGQDSALFKLLSPDEASGLKAQIEGALDQALREQSAEVLKQFSLDQPSSALSRLVSEIRTNQGAFTQDLKDQVTQVVGEFSLDKPDSIMNRLTGLLSRTHEQIGKNLTLDDDQSALSRLKRELKATIDDLARKNGEFYADVRSALSALEARKDEAARSTRHGATFEDALGGLLRSEAQRVGDVHRSTGAQTGAIKNCKVGDHVIAMGPDSAAPGATLVFEAKEDKSYDLRAALDEIEKARKNREAQIGVFVFSARTAPEGLEPLARYGDDIAVVWDAEDESSDLVLRCAYSLARALASRVAGASSHSAEAQREIDLAIRAVEKQLRFLDDVHTMAGTVKRSGEKIEKRMELMREELAAQVTRLDQQLAALRAVEG